MSRKKIIYNDYFDINRNTVEYKWNMGDFHNHISYEIYYLEKGGRKMLVQDRVYDLSAGDVLLIKPDILHRSMHSGSHTRINIVFSDAFLDTYFTSRSKKYLISCFDTEFIRLSDNARNIFFKLFSRLCSENERGDETFITISEILKLLNIAAQNGTGYDEIKKKTFSEKTNSVIDFIKNNFSAITELDEIADACYINKSYMCRLFKREVGMTVFEYLNNVKIQNACELMRHTDRTLTDIAISCGFSSVSYFSASFKSLMKCTPSQFRKKMVTSG